MSGRLPLVSVLLVVSFTCPVCANTVTNGDFSAGLSGWDTPWGGVTWNSAGEYAEIHEQSPYPALEQAFDLLPGDTTLSFRYSMQVSGTRQPPPPYDAFTATLWDTATWTPIFSNPDPFTDYFYLENDGFMQLAPGVSEAGGMVTADFFLPSRTNVLLSFELFGENDGLTTQVNVDEVTAETQVIPEPVTMVSGLMGLSLVGAYLRRRLG